jgi:hypothetical protein
MEAGPDMSDHEDDVPLLENILRPGDGPADKPPREAGGEQSDGPTLSAAEIDAIAHRVVERHNQRLEEAVARAIRKALEIKARKQGDNRGSGDGTPDKNG